MVFNVQSIFNMRHKCGSDEVIINCKLSCFKKTKKQKEKDWNKNRISVTFRVILNHITHGWLESWENKREKVWQTKYLKKQWSIFSQIWWKKINLDIQKTQHIPKRIKTTKITLKCIIVKIIKTKGFWLYYYFSCCISQQQKIMI